MQCYEAALNTRNGIPEKLIIIFISQEKSYFAIYVLRDSKKNMCKKGRKLSREMSWLLVNTQKETRKAHVATFTKAFFSHEKTFRNEL